jgi:Dickkopf N-terminal cysteine-rich region
MDAPPLVEKLPTPDVYCAPDAVEVGNQCPLNFCGFPKSIKTLAVGEVAELGTDSVCTPGTVCVPDGPTTAGDALALRCAQPFAPAAAFGVSCVKTAGAAGMRCKNDALCIAAPGAPTDLFCSQLCAADADCATGAYCLEYKSETLPNGSYVNLGFCTPKSKITGAACTREADCTATQGCLSYGARTNLLTCQNATGTKSMGDACTDATQCRSGECYDREFKLYATGNRDYCSGHCSKNSDCAADQRCTPIVLSNNDTPSNPFDDVVAGYCQTLFTTTVASACKANGDCTTDGADTCDVVHGLCYKATATTGTPCTGVAGCAVGAVCSTGPRFPGGYCQAYGCATGGTGVDACAGANATCSQRTPDKPLDACYEGCTIGVACSRAAESYRCSSPTDGAAASICLFDPGV